MPVGEPGEDGTYPEGTINYLVVKRFEEIAEALKVKKEAEKKEENEKNAAENNKDKENPVP
jgi:hypothetical protein